MTVGDGFGGRPGIVVGSMLTAFDREGFEGDLEGESDLGAGVADVPGRLCLDPLPLLPSLFIRLPRALSIAAALRDAISTP